MRHSITNHPTIESFPTILATYRSLLRIDIQVVPIDDSGELCVAAPLDANAPSGNNAQVAPMPTGMSGSVDDSDLLDQVVSISRENRIYAAGGMKALARFKLVCTGNFNAYSEDLWKPPSASLMLFVSSTFTDTHLERDRLQESILPKLRRIARLSGIAVVIYDMRWGVRDENTADHFTWVGCHDELQNCVQGSDGKFFLSLQSNKYGYCMLPKAIPKLVLDERLLLLSPEESNLCAEWYILNENTIPQEYVLKSLKINGYNDEGFADIGGADYWRNAYPKLLKALDGVAFWPQNDKCLVGQSVTEYEFKEAARLGIDRCAWLKREVSGDVAS